MAWDLDTAKKYLGIDPGDNSKDTQIQGVMDYVLKSIETMLYRGLMSQQQTEEFRNTRGNKLLLYRYPVDTVDQVNGEADFGDVDIRKTQGIIEAQRFGNQQLITVLYTGGYATLPADLERAMWEAFMHAWGRTDETTGGPEQTGGVVQGSGEVKSVTVFDGFKLDYDVGVTNTAASGLAQDIDDWGWLAPWAGILTFYRSDGRSGLEVL